MTSRNLNAKPRIDHRYKGGISTELILPEYLEITKDMKCRKCNDLVYDPVLCIFCEGIYCRLCSKNLNKNQICLNCKKEFIQKNLQRPMLNILFQTNIRCLFFQNGCSKIIKYPEFFDHVHKCKFTVFRSLSPGIHHNLSRSYIKKFMNSIKIVNKSIDGENKLTSGHQIHCSNCKKQIPLQSYSSHNGGNCLKILNSMYEEFKIKLGSLSYEKQRLSDLISIENELKIKLIGTNNSTDNKLLKNGNKSISGDSKGFLEIKRKYPFLTTVKFIKVKEEEIHEIIENLNLDFNKLDYTAIKNILAFQDDYKNTQTLTILCGMDKIDLCKFVCEQLDLKSFKNVTQLIILLSSEIPSKLASDIISIVKDLKIVQTLKIKANLDSKDLQDAFLELKGLKYLKISSIINMLSFGSVLRNLRNLKALNLEENNLNSKDCEALSEGISNCLQLESLNLKGNPMNSGLKYIIQILNKLKNLRYLNLTNTGLSDADKLTSEFCKKLKNVPELSYLILDSNDLSNEGMDFISNHLKEIKKLSVLSLMNTNISTLAAIQLARNIVYLKQLQQFDIGFNSKISSEALKDIIISLSNLKSIIKLKLNGTNLNLDCIMVLTSEFELFKNLESLNIGNINVNEENIIKKFAQGLKNLSSLKKLDLQNNNLSDEDVYHLSLSLRNLPNLTKLNLSDNKFTTDGVNYLSQSFEFLKNLENLILNGNSLGTDGARKIMTNLKRLEKLKSLNLSQNNIDHNGCLLIAYFCRDLKNIKFLNLKGNSIIDENADVFQIKNLEILI